MCVCVFFCFMGHLTPSLLNVGVAFGAAFDAILQSSTQLVGMSAGVYALMGMHYADAPWPCEEPYA